MELIKITNNNGTQAVSARELYAFLEGQTQFTKWCERMFEYGFSENQDYVAISQKRLTAQGNQTTFTDYALTLDTAKQICMLQRNEKGQEARKYFIEAEKAYQKGNARELSRHEILRLAIEAEEENQKLKVQVEELAPKGAFFDAVMSSDDTLTMNEASKVLRYGSKNLFAFLRERKILMQNNVPYEAYMNRVYFKVVESTWTDPDTGKVKINYQTQLYQKGLNYVRKLLGTRIPPVTSNLFAQA